MTDPVRRDEKDSTGDDGSAIRERSTSVRPAASAPPRTVTSATGSVAAARGRLEEKLRTGRALLASLPAGDDRARLLHVAIMRRDESLLDGVLSSLGIKDSTPPNSR
jgi:hypothetical protein